MMDFRMEWSCRVTRGQTTRDIVEKRKCEVFCSRAEYSLGFVNVQPTFPFKSKPGELIENSF